MPAKIYYDKDADLSLLKNKTIAILGYGSQGHAQAQNLRDSGCNVIIGELPGSPNYDLAVTHGFKPLADRRSGQARRHHHILLPDEVQADVFQQFMREQSEAGQHPDVLARLQHPLRPGRPADGRRRACWSPPRAPATWCAASSRKGAACPA